MLASIDLVGWAAAVGTIVLIYNTIVSQQAAHHAKAASEKLNGGIPEMRAAITQMATLSATTMPMVAPFMAMFEEWSKDHPLPVKVIEESAGE